MKHALLPRAKVADFLSAISGRYRALGSEGVRAQLHESLQFDTPDRSLILSPELHDGTKTTVRYRRYESIGQSFFEVEHLLANGEHLKRRLRVDGLSPFIQGEAAELLTKVCGLAPHDLEPALGITFRRMSLLGADTEEVVNIDLGLHFVNENGSAEVPGIAIVEIKHLPGDDISPVTEVLDDLGARPRTLSKYCTGLTLLDPSLKTAQFREQLRHVMQLGGEAKVRLVA